LIKRRLLVLDSAPPTMTVEELINKFLVEVDVKPATRAAYRQTTQSLIKSLGSTKSVAQLTSADADTWRASCVAEGLAKATIAKRTNVAKTIFKKAVKLGVIKASPFEDLKVGSQVNSERSFYVSREVISEVLEQCPNIQWRAIVGLTRYAGLRCPSELQQLKWSDIDWSKKLLTVHSPKTEHHAGHAVRIVPVAPEIQPILFELFEMATEGDVLLFSKLKASSGNLRTTFHKIIVRAGHKPWARLFQNLRGSCETDWVGVHPAHEVASWLGHSPTIAVKHYLKHKDLNVQAATGPGIWIKKSNAESNAQVTQNTTQHQAAPVCTFSQFGTQPLAPYDVVRDLATVCKTLQSETMGEEGFEPSKA
jgi:integrase